MPGVLRPARLTPPEDYQPLFTQRWGNRDSGDCMASLPCVCGDIVISWLAGCKQAGWRRAQRHAAARETAATRDRAPRQMRRCRRGPFGAGAPSDGTSDPRPRRVGAQRAPSNKAVTIGRGRAAVGRGAGRGALQVHCSHHPSSRARNVHETAFAP